MFCPIKQRPSKRLLIMWQMEGSAILLILCALGVWLYTAVEAKLLVITAIVLSLTMLTVYIYLPQLWRSMTYERKDGKITLNRGVIWRQTKIVYRNQVQYVTIKQRAIERLFGLSTVRLNTPGGKTDFRGLTVDDSKRLCDAFERRGMDDGSGACFRFVQNEN